MWKDRNGRTISTIGEPGFFTDLELSPTGERLAVTQQDPKTEYGDVWIIDLQRDVSTRFTDGSGDATGVIWSPDESRLVFSTADDAPPFLHTKDLTGGSAEVLLPSRGTLQAPLSWSPLENELLFADRNPETAWDIWVLRLDEPVSQEPFMKTPAREIYADFSPDGKWIAYSSNESGQNEVYVRPYRGRAEKQRVSTQGGIAPRWRADGRELFYVNLAGTLMAVPTTLEPSFAARTPVALFAMEGNPVDFKPFDVSADGQRFVVATTVPGEDAPPTVILDWPALLRRSRPGR